MVQEEIIEIYTDGSGNKEFNIGAWAAIIFYKGKIKIIDGIEKETTHNRMELMAVIEAIHYVVKNFPQHQAMHIYTDSQYVERIPLRAQKLITKKFTTNKGKDIQNKGLVKTLLGLTQELNIEFIKVKAHQKSTYTANYNREVDKHTRKLVRQEVNKNSLK
ncbi:MAG: RNase H family protein [Bacteroidales bacterium]